VKVIVTRPRAQAQPLVGRIEELGYEVVECPLIEIVRTSDEPIDCSGYEWAVITSPNGADEVARRARNLPQVAAVGPGTAETLRGHGIEPAFVASVSTAEHMAGEFPDHDGKVIYLAAENSRRGPIDALEADFVALYSTVLLEPEPPEGDVVVLASGSAARAYSHIGGSAPAVSIGPETTRVAQSLGIEVVVEAKTHDLDGLVAAVEEHCSTTSRS
jgi:uroporphyrinogen III methyltransferase/synthase